MGYRHGRQVVARDRRLCGKETQRASEVVLQSAAGTLNASKDMPAAHTHTHADGVGKRQARGRSGMDLWIMVS